jgi:hypothetical protein
MFGDKCRHCSLETTLRPYTRIDRNPVTGIYKPKGLGKTVVQLGAFCSNINKWVADMKVCPVRWMKENPPKIKTISPPKKKVVTKVKQPLPQKSVVVKAKQVLSLKKRVVDKKKKPILPTGQTQLWFGKRRKK